MRILRVVTRLNVGGPSRQIAALHRSLLESDVDQMLVTGICERDESVGADLATRGVCVMPSLHRGIAPCDDAVSYRALSRLIRRIRPDVVHTHLSKAGVIGRLAAAANRVPTIVHTFHGHVFKGHWSRVVAAAILRTERFLAARTSAVVMQSPSQQEEISGLLGIDREGATAMIRPGIEYEGEPLSMKSLLERRRSLRSRAPVLLFVGRMIGAKNFPAFARVAARVAAIHDDLRIRVVARGDPGAMRDARRLVADLGIASRTDWRADVDDARAMIGEATLLFMPSLSEGTPITLIESLDAGCPVVAYDVGGIRDTAGPYVREGAVELVTSGRENDAAAALAAIIAGDAERDCAALDGASSFVRRSYATSRLATDLLALYERLSAASRTAANR